MSPKTGNKAKISALTTLIRDGSGRLNQLNNARKENRRHTHWKRKISLCAGDVMVYVEVSKESTQKLVELNATFGKSQGTEMNLPKDVSKMAE